MTRINTNVSSLVAQNTLSRSSADLQQSLTRLSTGLRINSGKDDPAGLIVAQRLISELSEGQTEAQEDPPHAHLPRSPAVLES